MILKTVFLSRLSNGTAHFFAFWLIIEGATEKVLQFILQLKSIYYKNLGFIEQKMFIWTLQRGSNKEKFINWHHFLPWNFFSNELFSAALFRLMLVLRKDVLFHLKLFQGLYHNVYIVTIHLAFIKSLFVSFSLFHSCL